MLTSSLATSSRTASLEHGTIGAPWVVPALHRFTLENFWVMHTFAARSECSCSCFGIRERNRVIEQFASGDGLYFPQTHFFIFFCVGIRAAFLAYSGVHFGCPFSTRSVPRNFFVQLTFTNLQVLQWHCEGNRPL